MHRPFPHAGNALDFNMRTGRWLLPRTLALRTLSCTTIAQFWKRVQGHGLCIRTSGSHKAFGNKSHKVGQSPGLPPTIIFLSQGSAPSTTLIGLWAGHPKVMSDKHPAEIAQCKGHPTRRRIPKRAGGQILPQQFPPQHAAGSLGREGSSLLLKAQARGPARPPSPSSTLFDNLIFECKSLLSLMTK